MTLKQKKTKTKRKTAKDFGDKTPADYEREKKKVRKVSKEKIKKIDKRKSRSISLDLAGKHATEPWEQRKRKKKKKKSKDVSDYIGEGFKDIGEDVEDLLKKV